MSRAPDFFAHLDAGQLDQLEAFARQPSTTNQKCLDWLMAMGIRTSIAAVKRWRRRFLEADRMSAAAELADAIHTASANAGAVDVAGAVNLQLAQRLQYALVKGGDKLAIGDLLKGAMAVNALTNAQGKLQELKQNGKREMDELKKAVVAGAISPDRIEAASKKMFG